eukprot:5105582-Amphidinium_carterae.2
MSISPIHIGPPWSTSIVPKVCPVHKLTPHGSSKKVLLSLASMTRRCMPPFFLTLKAPTHGTPSSLNPTSPHADARRKKAAYT